MQVYDMRSGDPQHVANLLVDDLPIPLAWSAEGRVLAAGSAKQASIWHVPPTSTFPPPSSPSQAPAPAGNAAAGAADGPGLEAEESGGAGGAGGASAAGDDADAGGGAAAVQEVPHSDVAAAWAAAVKPARIAPFGQRLMFSVDVSHDGEAMALAGTEFAIQLWDTHALSSSREAPAQQGAAPAPAPVELHGHQGAVLHTRFSPDGQYMATCSLDNTLRIWRKNAA